VRQTILRCVPEGTGSRPSEVESPVRLARTLVGIVGALLLAACGAADPEVTTGEPPPTAGGDEQPSDPDAVVLSVTDVGGFVRSDRTFTNAPRLLVAGDGRVIKDGPVIATIPAGCCPTCFSGYSTSWPPRRTSPADLQPARSDPRSPTAAGRT
jgi:hypothetical protein